MAVLTKYISLFQQNRQKHPIYHSILYLLTLFVGLCAVVLVLFSFIQSFFYQRLDPSSTQESTPQVVSGLKCEYRSERGDEIELFLHNNSYRYKEYVVIEGERTLLIDLLFDTKTFTYEETLSPGSGLKVSISEAETLNLATPSAVVEILENQDKYCTREENLSWSHFVPSEKSATLDNLEQKFLFTLVNFFSK